MTAVVLWVASLYDIPVHSDDLDDVERGRRDAHRWEDDRRRFVGGALLVRRVAAAALGVPAAQVPVDRRCPTCALPHGRPTVAGGPFLSVSHAGDRVVLAVCDPAPVGVDVEMPRPDSDLADLRDLVLSPVETARPTPDDQLLRTWVRKEAVLKAAGVGLTVGMDTMTLAPADRPAAVLRYPAALTGPIGVADVFEVPGVTCAVAALADDPIIVTVRDGTPLVRP